MTISANDFIKILKGENTKSEYEDFYITIGGSDSITIMISGVTVNEEININEGYDFLFPYAINLYKIKFEDNFIFDKCVFNETVTFHECEFVKGIDFEGGRFRNLSILKNNGRHVKFHYGVFGSVNLIIKSLEELWIGGGVFNSIFATLTNVEKFIIQSNDSIYINSLRIGQSSENVNFDIEGLINRFYLSGTYTDKNIVEIKNSSFWSLIIAKFDNKGRFLLSDTSANSKIVIPKENSPNWNFDYFDNDSIFRKNKNSKSELVLENSILEVSKWTDVDLKSFSSISVINTDLSNVQFSNTFFPSKTFIGNDVVRYEVFNQLHLSSKKNNNQKNQIEYLRSSRHALLCSYLKKGKWQYKIPSIVSLSASLIYSNYGTNWFQSILVTIGIGCVFFVLIMFTSLVCLNECADTNELFKNLIHFLYPTHKMNFMDGKFCNMTISNTFPFAIYDSLGRLFIGIGIFETIRSFRKYTR